jgi:hypothetical protein
MDLPLALHHPGPEFAIGSGAKGYKHRISLQYDDSGDNGQARPDPLSVRHKARRGRRKIADRREITATS